MPTLTGLDAPTFLENAVNAAPQIIDGDVTVTGSNFNGGVLTLIGLLAEDRVSIQSSGPITFNAGTGEVRYNGVLIGTASGGVGATFSVTFNAAATAAGVEAVVEHLTYASVTNDPTASRDLRLFLTDSAGDPSLGSVQFVERHGAASIIDTSLPNFREGDAFVVWTASPNDPSLPYYWIYVDDGVRLDLYFAQFGDQRHIGLQATSGDPFAMFDLLGVLQLVGSLGYNFALGDLDADGDPDIVSATGAAIAYWSGDFTNATAVPGGGPFAGISWSGHGNVALADLDDDGDLDFLIGSYLAAWRYFENTGTAQAAAFTERTGGDNPFAAVATSYAPPSFADVDGDADLDMVLGVYDGPLHYYENTGTATAAVFTQRTGGDNPFNAIPVMNWAATLLADVDQDGDLDLLARNASGYLTYYENMLVGHALPVTVTPEADPNTSTNGDDLLTGSLAPDTLDGGLGNDKMDGGDGDDALTGGAGADILKGGTGADAMFGGTGNDTYYLDDEGDTADETGGDGVDLIVALVDVVLPTAIENLTIAPSAGEVGGIGNSLANVITGNAKANILLGQGGNDTLIGGGGADTLGGGSGVDSLDGGVGDDSLNGGAENDILVGGAGNDLLNGGTGADQMAGGAGHDRYVVDSIGDSLTEAANAGTDTVESTINFTLGANFENLTLTGSANLAGTGNAARNVLTGNAGDNTLSGGAEIDTLNGGAGDDLLLGGTSADSLSGGVGDDVLRGQEGADRLTGGTGADRFLFGDDDLTAAAVERDQILDLSFASGDVIDLSAIDANTTLGGDQGFVWAAKFTKVAGQAILKYAGGVTTLELDVDGDGKADFRVAITGDHSGTAGNLYTGAPDADGGWLL